MEAEWKNGLPSQAGKEGITMKSVKVQPLTQEAFAPYGKVLTIENLEPAGGNPATHYWYPQVAVVDAPTSINLMPIFPRPFTIQNFEAHDHTAENLISMDGPVIVAVAKKGELKEENVAAFLVPQGVGVSIDAQVWHFVPFPLGKKTMCAVIFANGTSSNDIYFKDLPQVLELSL